MNGTIGGRIVIPGLVAIAVSTFAALAQAGPPCVPGYPIDPAVVGKCHDFGAGPELPPIPADFFEPGSEPFDGNVCFEGDPLGPIDLPGYPPDLEFGQANILVQRSGDPFDRCELPSPTEVTIETEVIALSLTSIAPITVMVNYTQTTQWDVKVDLSGVTPPPGSITATKTHCNGGTYYAELHVQPVYTFTKVSGPGIPVGSVVTLDTGPEGIDYQTWMFDPSEWFHDPVGPLDPPNPVCSGFHWGSDPDPTTECDCNCNGIRDKCDIEQGAPDGNGNGVPDECEGVCDGDTGCCDDGDECTTHECRNPPNGTCVTTYICGGGPPPIPTLSQWSLIVLSLLLLLAGGMVYSFRRRRVAAD